MALVLADRVKDTTTTTSTGTITLSGTAPTGYQNFSVIGNGNTTYYTIAGQGTTEWEVGIGTYTSSGTTLSRDTVLASSNGGSLVVFSAGTKDVFVTYPAERSVNLSSTALTSGRVPYATTDGLLVDSTNLTFNGTTLTANTIGAFTLGGTVAGGGNQINNVVIGTSTPLAGSFTTVSASTSVTTPSVTNAGTLALSATSTNIITASTNGSERMRIDNSGNVGIGTNAPGSALDVKGTLRLSGSSSGYVGLAPAAAAGSTTYTLPSADGTNGQALTTNGSGTLSWASAGGSPIATMDVKTSGSSATWTIPAGVTKVRITVTGGGGNGITNPNPGGGGGGTAIKVLTGLTPGNTLTYTVGGAGATSQVASGTQTITTISATGGANGNANSYGGVGGTGSNGDINLTGSGGGQSDDGCGSRGGGIGGASFWGGGAPGSVNGAGSAGTNYGGGGGGGFSSGGAGKAGVVVFEY